VRDCDPAWKLLHCKSSLSRAGMIFLWNAAQHRRERADPRRYFMRSEGFSRAGGMGRGGCILSV